MSHRTSVRAIAAFAIAIAFSPAQAAVDRGDDTMTAGVAVRHDTSPPLRDLLQTLPVQLPFESGEHEIPNQIFVRPDFETLVPEYVPAQPGVQRAPSGSPTPPTLLSVNGINNIFGVLPPDTNGDIGRNYYIQYINLGWAIFDKVTGARIDIPGDPDDILPGNSFWAGFGGVCQTNNSGDPVVLWDDFARRWVFTQFTGSGTPRQCFAVSTTEDPLGPYHRYEFTYPNFNDYPHVGIWVDQDGRRNGYYLVAHEFSGQSFVGASFAVVERDRMIAGQPAQFRRFGGLDNYGALPVHLEGGFKAAAHTCAPFVHFDSTTSEYLFWNLCVDWANVGPGSTLTPVRRVAGAPFSNTVGAVNQPSNAPVLDAFPLNLMYRASGRKFDGGAPTDLSVVINHTVNVGGGQGGVRWVHFDVAKTTGTGPYNGDVLHANGFDALGNGITIERIVDQGTYAPGTDSRFMGAISIDQSANLGLGHSVASATQSPEIRLTGRLLGDPAGTLRDETTCTPPGTGNQTSASGRWGDYATMSVDPADECTFWHTNEYYPVTAASAWNTRICSFRFPSCGLPDFTLINDSPPRVELCGTTPSNPQFNLRGAVLLGYTGQAALSTSGFPGGVTPNFSVNPINPLPGTSVLTLNGASAIASGEYGGTVTAISGALTRNVSIQFGVSAAAAGAPSLTAPANAATGVSVRPTLSWAATATALRYRVQLANNAAFTSPLINTVVTGTSYAVPISLAATTQYFWRVIPINYCGEGTASATRNFTTGVPGQCPVGTTPNNVFSDDAESTAAGWTAAGTGTAPGWTRVPAPAGTGMTTTVWRSVDHPTVSDHRLTSPAIAVPANSQATYFVYQTFHNLETDPPTNGCWDAGILEISTDNGVTFTQVPDSRLLTDPYTGPVVINPDSAISGQPGWCAATPNQSITSVVDLSSYAGQSIRLRLRTATDAFVAAAEPNGWFADNIAVRACQ